MALSARRLRADRGTGRLWGARGFPRGIPSRICVRRMARPFRGAPLRVRPSLEGRETWPPFAGTPQPDINAADVKEACAADADAVDWCRCDDRIRGVRAGGRKKRRARTGGGSP